MSSDSAYSFKHAKLIVPPPSTPPFFFLPLVRYAETAHTHTHTLESHFAGADATEN